MTNLFLQAPAGQGMGWVTPVFMAAMVAVMYFFMIRPQQQKAKEQKLFVAGIHGKINAIDETTQTILVEVADNVRIKMDKSAISTEYTKLAYPNKEA